MLPGLSSHIVTSSFSTPEDFESRYLSPLGSGFSLEPRLTQSAWFRPHNKSGSVGNLYLVGAGTHPGAGLPGVLSSAKISTVSFRMRMRSRPSRFSTPADCAASRMAIRHGSHSFYLASRFLPVAIREPSYGVYAFCRMADDRIDRERGGEAGGGRPARAARPRLCGQA